MDSSKIKFFEIYIVNHMIAAQYNCDYMQRDGKPKDIARLWLIDAVRSANIAWVALEEAKSDPEFVNQFPEIKPLFTMTY